MSLRRRAKMTSLGCTSSAVSLLKSIYFNGAVASPPRSTKLMDIGRVSARSTSTLATESADALRATSFKRRI